MDISNVTNGMRKVLPLKYCGAVIVAAGTASRMGGIDKVMAELEGEPMILRTVRTFQTCEAIREIIIVTREDLIIPIMGLCAGLEKVKAVVVGGSSRQESVERGLNALSDKVKLVAVQDGNPCQGYHQSGHRRCGIFHPGPEDPSGSPDSPGV